MALQKVNYESATDSYWVQMSKPEMELLASLLWSVRLGQGNIYKAAAMQLAEGISNALGDAFMPEAADEVGVYFALEDLDGSVGATIKSPYGVIEVTGGDVDDATLLIATQPLP